MIFFFLNNTINNNVCLKFVSTQTHTERQKETEWSLFPYTLKYALTIKRWHKQNILFEIYLLRVAAILHLRNKSSSVSVFERPPQLFHEKILMFRQKRKPGVLFIHYNISEYKNSVSFSCRGHIKYPVPFHHYLFYEKKTAHSYFLCFSPITKQYII